MSHKRMEDSVKWTLVVGLTILLAGISGFMVVKRQEFFPDMYQQEKHEPASYKAESDTVKVENIHEQH